jgi:protein TonB
MKKLIFIAAIFAAMNVNAQEVKEDNAPPPTNNIREMEVVEEPELPKGIKNNNEVYTFVEVMPMFRGEDNIAAVKWVQKQMIYPAIARENGLQGKVFIKFVVNKIGKIEDIAILKDNVGGGCAEEVIRVIKSMPEWEPGRENGNPVRVIVTLPITFKLEDPKPEEVKH